MAFCGQCGTLLASGNTHCPHCGAIMEPEIDMRPVEDFGTDNPTIASSLSSLAPGGSRPAVQPPANQAATPGQQRLVLRSDGGMVTEAQTYDVHTPRPSLHPNNQISPPRHTPLPQSRQAHTQSVEPKRRGGGVVLLITLLVLLLILGVTAVIVLRPVSNNSTPNPPVPAQQAQALLQQYYGDINNRDYRDAYNLWGIDPQHPRQTYDQFVGGYAHTQHVDITFGPITTNADGTVQLNLTIYATDAISSGTAQHVYQGNYLVGQQNGAWKILRASFQQIS